MSDHYTRASVAAALRRLADDLDGSRALDITPRIVLNVSLQIADRVADEPTPDHVRIALVDDLARQLATDSVDPETEVSKGGHHRLVNVFEARRDVWLAIFTPITPADEGNPPVG